MFESIDPDSIEAIDYYKSDVFSLGITFLQMATLETIMGLNKDYN